MNTPSDQVQAVLREASTLVSSGKQIEAIKLVRERFGLGLKEAKDMVDGLARGGTTEFQVTFQPTAPLATDHEGDVRRLLAAGNKIEAIKRVREQTGLGLKEAKDLVEAMALGRAVSFAAPAIPSAADSLSEGMAWPEIERLARAGKKIEAIKLHRQTFGSGLAEAKDAVEARLASAFPQTAQLPVIDEPQTLAQRLGTPGMIVLFVAVLVVLAACAAGAIFALGLLRG